MNADVDIGISNSIVSGSMNARIDDIRRLYEDGLISYGECNEAIARVWNGKDLRDFKLEVQLRALEREQRRLSRVPTLADNVVKERLRQIAQSMQEIRKMQVAMILKPPQSTDPSIIEARDFLDALNMMSEQSLMARRSGNRNDAFTSRDTKDIDCKAVGCVFNRGEKCMVPSRWNIGADGRCEGFQPSPPPGGYKNKPNRKFDLDGD